LEDWLLVIEVHLVFEKLVIGIYLVIVIWSLVIVLYLELEKLVIFEVAISYQQSAFFLVTDS